MTTVSTAEQPVIIGLTGGIASGKTTVSEWLGALGAKVIDADVIARSIVEPGEPAYEAIVEHFGREVLAEDGRLDRQALGARVFGDDAARGRLNAITHPQIGLRMLEESARARERGYPWVVYDAALIVENGIHHALGGLIVVAASPEVQLERIAARDGLSPAQAATRLDAQMPLQDKLAVADWVIDNDGSLEDTRKQTEELFALLTERFGKLPSGD